ncbi:MAG: hypothetical protein ABL970_09260 [Nitrospira sp.]
MKRIAMGVFWFFLLNFVILGVGGAIVGMSAGGGKNFQEGYQAGHAVGEEFGKKYGTLILLFSLGAAVIGTATGSLPGTKSKSQ